MNSLRLNEDNSFSFELNNYKFDGFRFSTEIVGLSGSDLNWTLVNVEQNENMLKGIFVHPRLNGISTNLKLEKLNGGISIRRSIRNDTDNDIHLKEWSDLRDGCFEIYTDAELYSTENCSVSFLNILWGGDDAENFPEERPKEFGTFINGKRYNEPLLGRILKYGKTENQPYPAQVIVSPKAGKSIALGLLSNHTSDMTVTYNSKEQNGQTQIVGVDTFRFFRGQESLLLKAGDCAVGETIYLGVADTKDITEAVEEYNALLKKELTLRTEEARQNVFKNGRVWGSWNLGLYCDISHDILLKQAAVISKKRKDLNWIQVDDGYTAAPKPGLFILEEPGIDRNKFPRGMKAFVEDIHKLNLKAALWMGLIVNPNTVIPGFAKDWLLLKKDGTPLTLPKGNKFLDFSLKEVREYFESVVKTVTHDWGFEGFKFDFWSDHFHCTDIAYRNPEFTGAMLRDWFWKTLRKYVGEEGFLLTCCCVGSGNPFIGQYADSYRCGIDIGHGQDWHGQVSTAFWHAMQAKFKVSQFILPNIDSIGDFSRIVNENMHRCWTSFSALSGAHVEYGGLSDKESAEFGPKTIEAFNWIPLGKMPVPIDFPVPCQDSIAPSLWLNSSENEDIIYLAVCNWNDDREGKQLTLTPCDLGLKTFGGMTCREFWSDSDISLEGDKLEINPIPLCDARVYIISKFNRQ